MRKIDDIIINTLNTAIPTDSFHPDGDSACRELYNKLGKGNVERSKAIKSCITVAADRVKNLKEQRKSNSDDITLSKALRSEQTTVINYTNSVILQISDQAFY